MERVRVNQMETIGSITTDKAASQADKVREITDKLEQGIKDLFEESNLDKGRRAFLPHFHVLICGENKKTLEQFFTKYFPSNYEFMLNKDTSPINIIKNILLTT